MKYDVAVIKLLDGVAEMVAAKMKIDQDKERFEASLGPISPVPEWRRYEDTPQGQEQYRKYHVYRHAAMRTLVELLTKVSKGDGLPL